MAAEVSGDWTVRQKSQQRREMGSESSRQEGEHAYEQIRLVVKALTQFVCTPGYKTNFES